MDNQEDNKLPDGITPVLIDTGKKRKKAQLRTPVLDPENTASRVSVTKLPKRLEALFILIADDRKAGGALLTREELDINPRTKDLSRSDKDALVKSWPKFSENLERSRELKRLREEEVKLALKADQAGGRLIRKHGIDDMPIADAFDTIAGAIKNQLLSASAAFAATSHADVHTDELSRELMASRIKYIKDCIWIARNLVDLGERTRATSGQTIADGRFSEEVRDALLDADALLLQRGIKIKDPQ